jgi:hypothetical protein
MPSPSSETDGPGPRDATPRRRNGAGRGWRRGAVALTAVSVIGLAACGSARHAATAASGGPAPTTTTTTTTTAGTTTTTTKTKPAVHHHPGPIVAPLTGLPVSRTVADRPAVVVKIDNVEAALPQTGPNQADVVYEEMVEGGLTRLAAVFQSQYPDPVGPVRSGRLTDKGIADDLIHPVLAYAGANTLFQPQLAAQPLTDVDDDTNPDLFVRDNDRAAPHNLYTTIAGLAALDTSHAPPNALWRFRTSGTRFVGAGVKAVASMSISFPAAAVQWTWDAKAGLWMRSQNGAVDLDAHEQQLSASNVIIQWIPYITSAIVTGEGAGADGGPIPEGEFVGSGTAWYLSGGAIVKGTWTRSSITAQTVYRDSGGTKISLQPGRTWVELPALGAAATLTP